MSHERGFTLIEVLVASTIFVGVLVIGVSSFSSINRLNEQIVRTRKLSQTGNFVMETLVRDIRSATGLKDPASGGFTALQYPFDFIVSTGSVGPSPNVGTTSLQTRTCLTAPCSISTLRTRTYSLNEMSFIVNGETGSLLPDGVGMKDITFSGVSHQTSSVQPYVTVSFTLVDLATANSDAPTEQTFQTTVTSLVYSQ